LFAFDWAAPDLWMMAYFKANFGKDLRFVFPLSFHLLAFVSLCSLSFALVSLCLLSVRFVCFRFTCFVPISAHFLPSSGRLGSARSLVGRLFQGELRK
jgi:hypothetical protein